MGDVLRSAVVNGKEYGFSEATYVAWNTGGNSSHNMNEYTTPGIYEIYGERVDHADNLPINNVGGWGTAGGVEGYGGHSFFGRLTVIAGSLKKNDDTYDEISVTQILMLSNRKGGDGNMYIRSYNQNNSPFAEGWSNWRKIDGTQEGYIFTNTKKMNQDWGIQTRQVGLNWMVDNGTYSGVYVNEEAIEIDYNKPWDENVGNGTGKFTTNIGNITYIETFHITTINDYAVAGQVNDMLDQMNMGAAKKDRQICQFKMATDFFSGTSSFKKRVYKGNDNDYGNNNKWSDWEEISGGGETVVDAKPLFDTLSNTLSAAAGQSVKAGLPHIYQYAISQVDPNVIYELNIGSNPDKFPILDQNNKIYSHFYPKWESAGVKGYCVIRIKYIDDFGYGNSFGGHSDSGWGWKVDITGTKLENAPIHYTYYLDKTCNDVNVSADQTTL